MWALFKISEPEKPRDIARAEQKKLEEELKKAQEAKLREAEKKDDDDDDDDDDDEVSSFLKLHFHFIETFFI